MSIDSAGGVELPYLGPVNSTVHGPPAAPVTLTSPAERFDSVERLLWTSAAVAAKAMSAVVSVDGEGLGVEKLSVKVPPVANSSSILGRPDRDRLPLVRRNVPDAFGDGQ